jgi:glucosamine 6-phosphate synthetase-like amidotransferase/phosphosugar isomerase protein
MCGIFAYLGHKPIPISEALKILHALETDQEQGEGNPVGGDGAGIAFLNEKDRLHLVKVGKTKGSPVDNLTLQLQKTLGNSCLILGHVRHASPEFKATTEHKECTQPYQPTCAQNLRFASAHNGKVENYLKLKKQLSKKHKFESAKFELIDSEVIPHLLEELLTKTKNPRKATHALFEKIEGTDKQGNTVVTIHIDKNEPYLSATQKGKTRGLIVWINPDNEVLVCSREKPVRMVLDKFLAENKYEKLITVTRLDSVNILAHFTLKHAQTS